MRNKLSKSVALLLVVTTVLTGSLTVFAAADSSSSGKEEVVYVMTDASGEVTDIAVVNIWGSGDITDYGDYSEVKMLNTNDEIIQDGDEITFTTEESRVYYQGILDSDTAIPWDVSIRYYIDGEEYSASEIAGMSGELEIKLEVTENTDCSFDFYDGYALQITVTLDTSICSNITANDATIANAGSDKQLTFTILPGNGISTVITADVTDFEMESISINGIQLNLDIEIDESELLSEVETIMTAVSELNASVLELCEGASELSDGASEVADGSSSLEDSMSLLNDGISDLSSGIATIEESLNTLNDQSGTLTSSSTGIYEALSTINTQLSAISVSTDSLSELVTASSNIDTGIGNLYDGIATFNEQLGYNQFNTLMSGYGIDLSTLSTQNTEMITQLTTLLKSESLSDDEKELYENMLALIKANAATISGIESYLGTLSESMSTIESSAKTLDESYDTFNASIQSLSSTLSSLSSSLLALQSGISSLTTSYGTFNSGLNSYTVALAQIASGYESLSSGVSSLSSGSSELLEGAGNLSDGADSLYEGTLALEEGANELFAATSLFEEETSDLDTVLEERIDEMISEISGGDYEVTSFVSSKNTDVSSVQFVIKTAAVEIAEEETAVEEAEEESSIWDKLVALFS